MNLLDKLERAEIERLTGGAGIPKFHPGDTVQVNVRVREGTRERMQMFEGVCIARTGRGINANFTVRKISYGEGVERVFPLYSPSVQSIKVKRRGQVRRAKLYYLRPLRGKAARITERLGGEQADNVAPSPTPKTSDTAKPVTDKPSAGEVKAEKPPADDNKDTKEKKANAPSDTKPSSDISSDDAPTPAVARAKS